MSKAKNPTQVRDRFSRLRRTVLLAEAPEKALTQQQFKKDCDMNEIVARARRQIPPKFMSRGVPHYGDFSSVPDLTEAYSMIERAEAAFMSLPAALRLELDNNPANLGKLTKEQIVKHGLGRESTAPEEAAGKQSSPSKPSPSPKPAKGSPKAGQAAPEGTEPSDD